MATGTGKLWAGLASPPTSSHVLLTCMAALLDNKYLPCHSLKHRKERHSTVSFYMYRKLVIWKADITVNTIIIVCSTVYNPAEENCPSHHQSSSLPEAVEASVP